MSGPSPSAVPGTTNSPGLSPPSVSWPTGSRPSRRRSTGPGGTGKTRLALQVAAELLEDFSDGDWLVALAPTHDPTLVTSAIALIVATPLALGVAIFLSEFAPPWLRQPVAFLVDLLAAIPSVVYGLWGIFVLIPIQYLLIYREWYGLYSIFGRPVAGTDGSVRPKPPTLSGAYTWKCSPSAGKTCETYSMNVRFGPTTSTRLRAFFSRSV